MRSRWLRVIEFFKITVYIVITIDTVRKRGQKNKIRLIGVHGLFQNKIPFYLDNTFGPHYTISTLFYFSSVRTRYFFIFCFPFFFSILYDLLYTITKTLDQTIFEFNSTYRVRQKYLPNLEVNKKNINHTFFSKFG